MNILPDIDPDDIISIEVIDHGLSTGPYGTARRIALQILYEVDITKHPMGEVLAHQLEAVQPNDMAREYLQQMLQGIEAHRDEYDAMINAVSNDWTLSAMAYIDRNILRVAIYELLNNQQLAIAIIIDEALRFCDAFGSEDTARFVNGVLAGVLERYNITRPDTGSLDGEKLP